MPPSSRLCKVSGCLRVTHAPRVMCEPHWSKVPSDLRDNILKHYQRGVHIDNQPLQEFNRAILTATQFVAVVESQERRSKSAQKKGPS